MHRSTAVVQEEKHNFFDHYCSSDAINENPYQLIVNELIASLYRYTFMNADMNQYLIFRFASTVVGKMTQPISCVLCWASSLAICAYKAHF